MDFIKRFFRNKAVGYYIAIGVFVLAVVTAIVFFSTFENPAFNGPENTPAMGNKASGLIPITIGIFLIAGTVIELVVLFAPEFRFFHLAAIIMFGLALYKDVLIIADFFAYFSTGVLYNGGNVGLNMFFLIAIGIIEIAAIVASFFGFVKEVDDDEEEDA